MQLYCPACKSSAQAAARCPRCGDRLVAPAELSAISRRSLATPRPLPEPSAAGRVLFGVVAALGLYVGGHELLVGLWVAGSDDLPLPAAFDWAVRVATVAVGGLLAGAGRRNGPLFGGLAGLVTAGMLLALRPLTAEAVTQLDLALAVGLAAVAAAAGRLGQTLWPAPDPVPAAPLPSRGSSLLRLKEETDAPRRVPFSWFRLAGGVGVALAGFLSADAARVALRDNAGQWLNLGTPSQVPLIDAMFATLALFAGGGVAGAATGAGLRHGVTAGIAVGVVFTVLVIAGNDATLPPLEGTFQAVGREPETLRRGTGPLLAGGIAATLVALGGTFGGLLLPKLSPPTRRKIYGGD